MRDDAQWMTIGAFARAVDVTPSALRFYDECGLVRPAEVDAATGYRYYAPDQVREVVLIRHLREVGLPLEDVRRALAGPVATAEALLADRLRALEDELASARATAEAALSLLRERPGDLVAVPGPALAGAIRQIAPAAGVSSGIEVLGGVLFEVSDCELRLVATDRYRLAIRTLAVPGAHTPASAVVVAPALEEALPWLDAQPSVTLGLDPGLVRLTGRAEERSLPAIGAPFPSYQAILDGLPESATRVVASRERLLRALGDDPSARLDLIAEPGAGGGLRVAEPGAGGGLRVGAIPVPAEVTGAPLAISFRHTTLHPAVSASVGPDVLLRFAAADQPAVVRSADDGDLTVLAMPVRASS